MTIISLGKNLGKSRASRWILKAEYKFSFSFRYNSADNTCWNRFVSEFCHFLSKYTIEWGEMERFSEKVELSKKEYLCCVLRVYVENPFRAVSNATVCCKILVLCFFQKPVLSQFTLVCSELGQWKVSNHSIIIFTFVLICMNLGCIETFQSF